VLHRRVTVGARFEYAASKRGYGHLQGWMEGLAAAVWAPRAFRGFFAEASLGIAHTVLTAEPSLHSVAVVPGVSAGLRWRFGKHFMIGAVAGLRWGVSARRNSAICTFSAACPAIRTGPAARVALELGVVF
jgi:hypothetical protein